MLLFKLPSASNLRREILNMAYLGQSVHVPSAFSIVEIVRVLHEAVLGWRNLIDFEQGVGLSLEMHNLGSPKLVAEKQLGSFLDLGAHEWLTA